jgi:heme/copper-type cytochrome/quinol oxidase subunit 2
MTTRSATHRAPGRSQRSTLDRARPYLFGAIVAAVLALGGWLAFGGILTRPAAALGTISVQSSMAGFTPSEIHVKAGSTVTLDWWTEDASMHLQDGVHTMIAPELGLYEALPAESRRAVSWTVPNKPGTYDVYCDSCCGGIDSPTMHGTIVVEPAS